MISKKATFIALFIATFSLISLANSPLNRPLNRPLTRPSLTSLEKKHLGTQEDLDVISQKIRNRSSDSNETYSHGDYIFIKLLAHGWMGSVFEGMQISTRKRVALKINNADVPQRTTDNEILMMKLIKGTPNTIPLLDVLRQEKNGTTITVIVMELFQGKALASFEYNVTQSQIQHIMYKTLETLAYSNQRNIIHNDLHAGNILVNLTTMDVIIVDWGLAKVIHDDGSLMDDNRVSKMDKYRDIYLYGLNYFRLMLSSHGFNVSLWSDLEKEYKNRTKCEPEDFYRVNNQNLISSCDSFVPKYNLSDVRAYIWDLIDKTMVRNENSTLSLNDIFDHPCFKEVEKSYIQKGIDIIRGLGGIWG